jgi:hypothetical protein
MTEPIQTDGPSKPPSLWQLLGRYLSFVWMFDDVPVRADRFVHASIVRTNRDRGIRFLPVYMRRYCRMLAALVSLGSASDVLAAPAVVTGACFTLSSVVAIALLVATIGFAALRWRLLDQSN